MTKKVRKAIKAKLIKEMRRQLENLSRPEIEAGCGIPDEMKLGIKEGSGFFLGFKKRTSGKKYIGKPSQSEGNIVVIGINGSSKSRTIGKSSLLTYTDQMIILDTKGEYQELEESFEIQKLGRRKHIVFNPKGTGKHYNPYALIKNDPENAIQYIREISHCLIEKPINITDPYWVDAARSLLSAIVAYAIAKDMDFSETMVFACSTPLRSICNLIKGSDCNTARMFLNDIDNVSKKQKAAVYSEMKEKILLFATDNDILEALSKSEDKDSFSWVEIEKMPEKDRPNVFLHFNQELLEQWSGLARLMISQLIAQLHRRNEKWLNGINNVQPLLIFLDEFPLLGRMEAISNAVTTLRSKGVTFCFMIQSIPQLDDRYGANGRKIILDNCQYKVILKVTEPASQKYLSELFGTVPVAHLGGAINDSLNINNLGVGLQISETREPLIYPEEFAVNEDILLNINGKGYRTYKIPLIERLQEKEEQKRAKLYVDYILRQRR